MSNEIKPSKKLPSYLKKIESGGLLIGFIYVLVFMSILALIISQITQSTNLNNTLSAIDERVLIIEEQINIADETNNDSLTEISSSIQFLDREVRKLWDLSNKKNRVDISKIKRTIDDINENLQNLNLNMGSAAKNIKGNKDLVEKIERQLGNISSIGKNLTELQSSIRSLETQIIIIDDSIVSLENYKKQLNQVINEVQTEIVSIKESIIKE